MKRIDWNTETEDGRRSALARPTQSRAELLRGGVEEIIATVRADGDNALTRPQCEIRSLHANRD